MTALDLSTIPEKAVGLRLCKMIGDDLRLCEPVTFEKGNSAVVTVLNRARIAGPVGPVGETGDFWADFLSENGDWFETIALSREAWNILKNRWMRCRLEPSS